MTLEEMLSESVADAEQRERSAFGLALAAYSGRMILCGAGNLGSKISAVLRRDGIIPLAFADRDIGRQGKIINGIKVLSPSVAVSLYGRNSLFLICIFKGSGDDGLYSRIKYYEAKGCTGVVSFLPLLWKYEDLGPHFGIGRPSAFLRARDEIKRTNAIWSDAFSRETYRQQLSWRLKADFSELGDSVPEQYFPASLFALSKNERIIDGGAFDGDTIVRLKGGYCTVWAIEPDPASCKRLRAMADDRIQVIECALGSTNTRSRFSASGTVAASVNVAGNHLVEVRQLDDLGFVEPTFLKLDIEGSELEALKGGQQLLRNTQLLAAVCLYHCPDHLWSIPLFLAERLTNHRFYLRCHQNDGFELVMYAVPHQRCRDDNTP